MKITIGDRELTPEEVEKITPVLDMEAREKWTKTTNYSEWVRGQKALGAACLREIDTLGIG